VLEAAMALALVGGRLKMNAKQKRLFETDRRMEMKLRLSAKRAEVGDLPETGPLTPDAPGHEILSRLIERVRRL
jgi:hypothetical protein